MWREIYFLQQEMYELVELVTLPLQLWDVVVEDRLDQLLEVLTLERWSSSCELVEDTAQRPEV